jgi:predicted ATPase/DNA-binding SARP family transcriptional activator
VDLRVGLLGSLRVSIDGGPLERLLGLGRRERALAVLLALYRGRVVTTGRLIDELWPEGAPDAAVNTVQVYVSRIRQVLGRDAVRTDPLGYALNLTAHDVDVTEFEQLADRGQRAFRSGRFGEAADVLRRALALWEGDCLEDGTELRLVQSEAVKLNELRLSVVEDHVEAELALGRGPDLIADLQDLVDQHPFRERLQATLMTALCHAGRQTEALSSYTEHHTRCVDELGIEPGTTLQQLQMSILAGGDDLTPVASPFRRLVKTLGSAASVPTPATPLVGREDELTALTTLLSTPHVRLVTLTGPGGTGKTRLATEVAHQLVEVFADGIYFVPLAAVTTEDVMWTSIAEAMDLPPEGRSPPAIFQHIAHRSCLMVLDNLEQLLTADSVTSQTLAVAPAITVMATSRRPLHLADEHEYPVSPLELPLDTGLEEADRSGAVRLFVQQAQMVQPRFVLTKDNTGDVGEICRRLDGLPLAIELAAARTKMLRPAALLAGLDRALDIAALGNQRPSRQKTIRATIAWSYHLLTSQQKAFFRRLGVFAGGATLDAVSAVAADLLDGDDSLQMVADLVDVSLITFTGHDEAEPRVRMLETIRSFAVDQLAAVDEKDSAGQRHTEYYVQLAEYTRGLLSQTRYGEGRARFEAEHDNLRQALAWSLRTGVAPSAAVGETEFGLRLCLAMHTFWVYGGYHAEARDWLQLAIERTGGTDSVELAECHAKLGGTSLYLGDLDRASRSGAAGVSMLRRLGNTSRLAEALRQLAYTETQRGDSDSGRVLLEEALVVARAVDDKRALMRVLDDYAIFQAGEGNFEKSRALSEEGLAVARDTQDSDPVEVMLLQHNLACTLREMGQAEAAYEHMRTLIPQQIELNNPTYLPSFAEDYAAVLVELHRHRQAVQLLGAADAMRERNATPRPRTQQNSLAEPIAKTRDALLVQVWEDAYQRGRDTSVEAALEQANGALEQANAATGS